MLRMSDIIFIEFHMCVSHHWWWKLLEAKGNFCFTGWFNKFQRIFAISPWSVPNFGFYLLIIFTVSPIVSLFVEFSRKGESKFHVYKFSRTFSWLCEFPSKCHMTDNSRTDEIREIRCEHFKGWKLPGNRINLLFFAWDSEKATWAPEKLGEKPFLLLLRIPSSQLEGVRVRGVRVFARKRASEMKKVRGCGRRFNIWISSSLYQITLVSLLALVL